MCDAAHLAMVPYFRIAISIPGRRAEARALAGAMEQHMTRILGSIPALAAMATLAEAHEGPLGHVHDYEAAMFAAVFALVGFGLYAAIRKMSARRPRQ